MTSFRLSDLSFGDGVKFTECNFRDASFANSVMPGASFTDCNLTGADFTGANLPGASFVRCAIAGSRLFDAVDLSGVSVVFGSQNDSEEPSE